jgi:hypothetical protein
MPPEDQRGPAVNDGGEAVRKWELRLEERPVQILRETLGDEQRQASGNIGEGEAVAQAQNGRVRIDRMEIEEGRRAQEKGR